MLQNCNPLSMLWQSNSVHHTSHHCPESTTGLQEENHTHLEHRASLRLLSISQVLGTDMKKHFDILSRFQVRHKACMLAVLLRWECW